MGRPAGSRRRRGRFGARTTPKSRSRQRCFPCFGPHEASQRGRPHPARAVRIGAPATEPPGDRCGVQSPRARYSSRNVSARTPSHRPAHRSCFECFTRGRSARGFASRGRARRPVRDAGSPAPRRSARTTREAPRRVAGFHPGPFSPKLPPGDDGLATPAGPPLQHAPQRPTRSRSANP